MKESKIIIISLYIFTLVITIIFHSLGAFSDLNGIAFNILCNLYSGILIGLITSYCTYFIEKKKIINDVYNCFWNLYVNLSNEIGSSNLNYVNTKTFNDMFISDTLKLNNLLDNYSAFIPKKYDKYIKIINPKMNNIKFDNIFTAEGITVEFLKQLLLEIEEMLVLINSKKFFKNRKLYNIAFSLINPNSEEKNKILDSNTFKVHTKLKEHNLVKIFLERTLEVLFKWYNTKKGDFMKKNIKLAVIVSLIIIIFVFIIPIGINVLFKFDLNIWWLESEWLAGDALVFYGSIISTIIGIVGVYITINIAQKNYRDDIVNQALPFFAINFLTRKYIPLDYFNLDDIDEENVINENKDDNIEYRLRKINFILSDREIRITTELTPEQVDLIKHNGEAKKHVNPGQIIITKTNLFSQAIELENVGKGTAINVRIGINKFETEDKDKNLLMPVNLKPNEFFYINVFSEDFSDNISGKYILEINYSDIYNNEYIQEYPFEIKFQNKDGQDGYMVDFEYRIEQKRIT